MAKSQVWLRDPATAQRGLATFAASLFVFHQLPAVVGGHAGDAIDLVTPFSVVGAAAAVLLAAQARGAPLVLAAIAAVLYVDGHGIHLAANSIGHESLSGDARDVTRFWDELFGHIEWHVGWIGLLAAFCLAERGPTTFAPWMVVTTVALLGFTLFTSGVEGGTWWLMLAAAAVFVPWAVRRRRALLVVCASSLALAAALIGVWAVWHSGLPQFSEVGFI